jgi:hypothetical protein
MEHNDNFPIDAPAWSPSFNGITLVRRPHAPYGDIWFSSTGNVVVADVKDVRERVVARRGEVPTWSPDGTQLAFARCRITQANPATHASDTANCSLWIVRADGTTPARLLTRRIDSAPVWSPDGGFLAYLRDVGSCTAICRRRIVVVSSSGGAPHALGPLLIESTQLFWLPSSAPAVLRRHEEMLGEGFQLQRCVDIWNRARMRWSDTVANVSTAKGRCVVTIAYPPRDAGFIFAGFECTQPVPFTFDCPSHGANKNEIRPNHRVWNAQVAHGGTLYLFRRPSGRRLPVPKRPPYPILDGYILLLDRSGKLRNGLTYTATVVGRCSGAGSGDIIGYPNSIECGWQSGTFAEVDHECFKRSGPLRRGDIAYCSNGAGSTKFIRVKASSIF